VKRFLHLSLGLTGLPAGSLGAKSFILSAALFAGITITRVSRNDELCIVGKAKLDERDNKRKHVEDFMILNMNWFTRSRRFGSTKKADEFLHRLSAFKS
jgi:hypothetical protein